jgi:hypothetical protein
MGKGKVAAEVAKMNLQSEFQDALARGADDDELLDVVRRYKSGGGNQREAYDALHAIWSDHGYAADTSESDDPTRDQLEYVMEIVWGFCSTDQAIWETTLSKS